MPYTQQLLFLSSRAKNALAADSVQAVKPRWYKGLRHCEILCNLAVAAITEAILMWTSAEQVPSLHRVAPRYMKVVSFSDFWLFMVISALVCAVDHDLAAFCADFHPICHCSVYESVGVVLKFTIAASHKINVIGKS